jgi:hypothetical protein
MTRPRSRVRAFGQELRRRRVPRVAVIYAAAGWVAVEASDTIAPLLLLPGWTSTLVLFRSVAPSIRSSHMAQAPTGFPTHLPGW